MIALNEQRNVKTTAYLTRHLPCGILEWLSAATTNEPHLIPQSAAQLGSTLRAMVVATKNGQTIGVCGLFEARTRSGTQIMVLDQQLVELGSLYIEPVHRGEHLSKQLMCECVSIAKEHNWRVVCITSNRRVQVSLPDLGFKVMNDGSHISLKNDLCVCEVRSDDCLICPFKENASWIF